MASHSATPVIALTTADGDPEAAVFDAPNLVPSSPRTQPRSFHDESSEFRIRTARPPLSRPNTLDESSSDYKFSQSRVSTDTLCEDLSRQNSLNNDNLNKCQPAGGSTKIRNRRLSSNARKKDISVIIFDEMSGQPRIGFNSKGIDYMTSKRLSLLITTEVIKNALPSDDDSDLPDLIVWSLNNKKLFATTALTFDDKSDRLEALVSFHEHGLSDRFLPVTDFPGLTHYCAVNHKRDRYIDDQDVFYHDNGQQISVAGCKHRECERAFHHPVWNRKNLADFHSNQSTFLVHKFNKEDFTYDVDPDVVLPFEVKAGKETTRPQGHFGWVYPKYILTDHQDVLISEQMTTIVAVKELKPLHEDNYSVKMDWKREAKALKTFNKLKHDHIIKGVGAFYWESKYYLLMEWADGGNLQTAWKENVKPMANGLGFLEILIQFRGLAHALNRMHDYALPDDEEDKKRLSTHGVVINEPQKQKNWRHSDIKPANILRMLKPGSLLGTLKIADLGRAKLHTEHTVNRVAGTSEQFGTLRYEPPEIWSATNEPRSRRFDIWSIGCVMLETVIWFLYGTKVVDQIGELDTGASQSPYWKQENLARRTAKVSDLVIDLTRHILDTEPECRGDKDSALRDLLLLIRDKLLVLIGSGKLQGARQRLDSRTLFVSLSEIISKANDDPSYLWKERDRSAITPPSINPRATHDNVESSSSSRSRTDSSKRMKHSSHGSTLDPDNITLNPGDLVTRRTSMPHAGRGSDSYKHDFMDVWKFKNDNHFAQGLSRQPALVSRFPDLLRRTVLCSTCNGFRLTSLNFRISETLTDLKREARRGCEFCNMRLRVAEKFESGELLEFDRCPSGLRLNSQGSPVISLHRTAGAHNPEDNSNYVQIGSPIISTSGSASHFDLLRAWLNDCDKNHEGCKIKSRSLKQFPTRLIFVGSSTKPKLQLVDTASFSALERKSVRYCALSYAWGDRLNHPHVQTTPENLDDHKVAIRTPLPKTLADAVTTVRAIGLAHIWIDALCVIQGPKGDFAVEAGSMESVFSSAYCILAATSAHGSSVGFLDRPSPHEIGRKAASSILTLPYSATQNRSSESMFVSESFDDFQKDVREGPLNKRGWVFQERALARRIIHFTSNQTYWECGHAIRCETMTKMRNAYEGFLGDPNFPKFGLQHEKGGDIAFYERVYEQYSALSFTNPEDRPFAIAGLEQRLMRALQEKGSRKSRFGIFDKYWGRGLLWQNAAEDSTMMRLVPTSRGVLAPSWSWMGYTGAITFMKHDPHSVEWMSDQIKLPWHTEDQASLTTNSQLGEIGLRGIARDFTMPRTTDAIHDAEIMYQDPDNIDTRVLKCLVIGRAKMSASRPEAARHYVLIVQPKASSRSKTTVYERVGAGYLRGSLIDFTLRGTDVIVE